MRLTGLIFVLFFTLRLNAQVMEWGVLPKASVGITVSDAWKFVAQIEQQYPYENSENEFSEGWGLTYNRTDITGILAYRVHPLWTTALGYRFRTTTDGIYHTSIQQLTTVTRMGSYRLGHRLRIAQHYQANSRTDWEFRYRLSAEFPLQGQKIDDNEWYLKTSLEQLIELSNQSTAWEQRTGVFVGYAFLQKHELETGIDYRLDAVRDKNGRHRFWMGIAWYLSL